MQINQVTPSTSCCASPLLTCEGSCGPDTALDGGSLDSGRPTMEQGSERSEEEEEEEEKTTRLVTNRNNVLSRQLQKLTGAHLQRSPSAAGRWCAPASWAEQTRWLGPGPDRQTPAWSPGGWNTRCLISGSGSRGGTFVMSCYPLERSDCPLSFSTTADNLKWFVNPSAVLSIHCVRAHNLVLYKRMQCRI